MSPKPLKLKIKVGGCPNVPLFILFFNNMCNKAKDAAGFKEFLG